MALDYFGNQLNPDTLIFRTFKYFGDFSLTALQLLNGQPITLKGQEAFFAIMRAMCTNTGAFRVSVYTSNSERYQSNTLNVGSTDRVRGECMYGTASRPAVLPVPILIPGSGSIMHDLEDVSNGNNALHLVYEGARLFPRSGSQPG